MVEPFQEEGVTTTLEFLKKENAYRRKERNNTEPHKKLAGLKYEFSKVEDLDEEEYEERENLITKPESGCQVVSLIFPDGTNTMMIVNEEQDSLSCLRAKLGIRAREQRRTRSYTTDTNISFLQFFYELKGIVQQVPKEMEQLKFKELLTLEHIKENVINECLVLYFGVNESRGSLNSERKGTETLREIVEITLNGISEFKQQVFAINKAEDCKKTEIIILNIDGEQQTYLKGKDLVSLEGNAEELKITFTPRQEADTPSFVVLFKSKEAFNLCLAAINLNYPSDLPEEAFSLERYQVAYDSVNDTRHFLVKKINRYGFKQKRLVWFCKDDFSFHITNLTLKSHKIHEMRNISQFIKKGKRKLSIRFENDSKIRDILILFNSALELYEFNSLAQNMIHLLNESQCKTEKFSVVSQESSESPTNSARTSRKYTWLNKQNFPTVSEESNELSYNVVQTSFISHDRRFLILNGDLKEIKLNNHKNNPIKQIPIQSAKIVFSKEDLRKIKIESGKDKIELIFPSVFMKYHFVCNFNKLKYPERGLLGKPKQLLTIPLKIWVSSWNIGYMDEPNSEELLRWLEGSEGHDVIALGFQECKKSKRVAWLTALNNYLDSKEYSMIAFISMWEMFLIIYARDELKEKITDIQKLYKPTGIAHIIGNKGGLVITFKIEETSYCFVSCHLAAREERVPQRNQNVKDLLSLKPSSLEMDFTVEFDYIFWFGDMNYRVEENYDLTVEMCATNQISTLWDKDQLIRQRNENCIFSQFFEGNLNFCPSYRWSRLVDEWSNKRNQAPSWTDRIMYKTHRQIELLQYTALHKCYGSDHKPITGSFATQALQWYMPEYLSISQQDPQYGIVEFNWLQIELDDSLHTSMIQLSFYSPFILCIPYSTKIDAGNEKKFRLEAKLLPTITIVFADETFVREQRVVALLWQFTENGGQEVIGQASLQFQGLFHDYDSNSTIDSSASLNSSEISAYLEFQTRRIGQIKASWKYYVSTIKDQPN
ncbi:INPP5D [Blepharisma stoltei]|uniref:Inositol polyphosphate-related phosphatase domain-containing protein n=1 Tax=Blepharisma stoltei TaxID=1481888 RepID=A0AAU9IDQ6_9CILI|nr:unnamed protein product [Blepharisma stoltei]